MRSVSAKLSIVIASETKAGAQMAAYWLTYLPPSPNVADPIWRLAKADGTTYDVHLGVNGPKCTCADFVFTRENKGACCKHVEAIRSVGLLKAGAA